MLLIPLLQEQISLNALLGLLNLKCLEDSQVEMLSRRRCMSLGDAPTGDTHWELSV